MQKSTEVNQVPWFRIADKFPGLEVNVIRAIPYIKSDGKVDFIKTTDSILEVDEHDGTAFWIGNGEDVDMDDVWTWDLENPPEFPSPIREDHMQLADQILGAHKN